MNGARIAITRGRVALALAIAACGAGAGELPPSGGAFRIDRSTLDGGGGRSQGGVFSLQGTIGQPDAARSSGGAYVLAGGFWSMSAGPAPSDAVFSNGFE